MSEKSETNTESNIYEGLKKDFRELAKKLNLEEEKFCVTKNGIRSYRELCLKDVWGSETIPEIILGPMCMQSRNELKCFLKANGLQRTRILVSKVPIR